MTTRSIGVRVFGRGHNVAVDVGEEGGGGLAARAGGGRRWGGVGAVAAG